MSRGFLTLPLTTKFSLRGISVNTYSVKSVDTTINVSVGKASGRSKSVGIRL